MSSYYSRDDQIEPHHIGITIVASLIIGALFMGFWSIDSGNAELTSCTSSGGGHACYTHNIKICERNGGGNACSLYQNNKMCLASKGGKSCFKSTDAQRLAKKRCLKYGGGKSCKNYK